MNDLMPIIAVVFIGLIVFFCVKHENNLEDRPPLTEWPGRCIIVVGMTATSHQVCRLGLRYSV